MPKDTVKALLYETVHRHRKSVAQLAEETNISQNYLYRASLPLDESGVRFPLDYLVPLMKATNNYSILKHIAHLCGYVAVRIPRVSVSKADKNDLVAEYQESTAGASRKLIAFFESPTEENFKNVSEALQRVMEISASTHKYINKEMKGQLELDL